MKNKNILIGVLSFIIVVLAGLCVYLLFIKKDEVGNNNQNNTFDNGNNSYNNINN